MTVASFEKSKRLEAILEMGRNWALATTVTVASLSLSSIEGIYETARYAVHISFVGVILSLGWYGLSGLRAFQVAELTTENWRQRTVVSILIILLYVAGLGLMVFVGHTIKNQRFVEICSRYEAMVDTSAHKDPLCQRLYQLRHEQKMLLESMD